MGELAHYGVPGMKWGVRRSKEALDRAGKRVAPTRKERNAQSKRKEALSRRRTLTDDDLNGMIKRLEQEKKLKTLINEDLRPGRAFVKRTLVTSGGKVATAVATGVGVAVVGAILSREWQNPKLGNAAEALAANIPKIKK